MADYTTELLEGNETTTKSTISEQEPNQIFITSALVVCSVAFSLNVAAFFFRFSPIIGSFMTLGIVLIAREWNRIYGSLLTPKLKASINYSTVLRDNREYIPLYDMDWLFGGRYTPYYYGCTGPSLNPDMDRTPDDPDSRSPTKERQEGDGLKKND